MVGCESGVELHDALTEAWDTKNNPSGLKIRKGSTHGRRLSNGVEKSVCRRDKYLMGEMVRAASVRAVKQEEIYQGDFR
jgi:hypothetical protein